jgi:integrase
MKRIKVPKYTGVYYRESSKKRHRGKPDRCFDICYRDQNGKLVWEKVGWTSEGYSAAMASHVRAERMRAIRHGKELPKPKKEVTFGEVWRRYNEWLETGKRRPRDDRYNYSNHLKLRFATKPLSRITPFDLEKMKAQLLKDGLAPATVKHNLVLVRQVINKAIAWGMWKGDNPVKHVKMPPVRNRRERFLSVDEAHILLNDLDKVRSQLHDMALLSLHTGLRAGEIFSLKWGHIDLENDLIHVSDPKSGRERKAPMTPIVRAMFMRRASEQPHVEDLVFKSRDGKQIKEISNAFARAVKRLGFNDGIADPRQKVTFHTLRHTFASWLALRGEHILTIKELLGHQSLAMTERYSHLIPDQKSKAVEGIEELFESVGEIKNIEKDSS